MKASILLSTLCLILLPFSIAAEEASIFPSGSTWQAWAEPSNRQVKVVQTEIPGRGIRLAVESLPSGTEFVVLRPETERKVENVGPVRSYSASIAFTSNLPEAWLILTRSGESPILVRTSGDSPLIQNPDYIAEVRVRERQVTPSTTPLPSLAWSGLLVKAGLPFTLELGAASIAFDRARFSAHD